MAVTECQLQSALCNMLDSSNLHKGGWELSFKGNAARSALNHPFAVHNPHCETVDQPVGILELAGAAL